MIGGIKMEKGNKNNTITTIVITILVIIIIGLLGYIIYKGSYTKNGDNTNNSNANNTTVKEEKWELTSDMIASISDKIDFEKWVLATLYYENDFDVNNISNEMILRLGYSKISSNWDADLKNGNIFDTANGLYRKISAADIDKNVKDLFGNSLKYNHQTFVAAKYGAVCGIGGLKNLIYDENKKEYITEFNQGGGAYITPKQYIYDTKKVGNEVEVYANIYFFEGEQSLYYKDFKFDDVYYIDNYVVNRAIGFNEVTCTDIKDCTDLFHKYVYTFVKDGNEFYLKSFKKLS